MNAIAVVLRLLTRLVLSVVVVAVILLLATPTYEALVGWASSIWRWPEVKVLVERISAEVGAHAEATDRRYAELRGLPASNIEARIHDIDRELQALSRTPRLDGASYFDLARVLAQGELESALRADLQRRIRTQEREALVRLQGFAERIQDRQAFERKVERRRIDKNDAKLREDKAIQRVRDLQMQRFCAVPGTKCHSDLERALSERAVANREAWRTHNEWRAVADLLPSSAGTGQAPKFHINRLALHAEFDAMSREVARVASWQVTAAQPIRDALVRAFWIVVAAVASAVAFKAFFFYVLAGLAERSRPLVVRQNDRPSHAAPPASRSALSLSVKLSENQELLVLGSHLQSAPDRSRTRTKWLLSPAHPLTSLACGMWMLTRVRAKAPCTVVISSTTDALEELSAVALAEGDALVVQPRHLVGAVHPNGRPIRLRGHWKFGTHAWLTLQFRYLVINGPCTLIVRGCRGVRVESTHEGRTLSQAVTVGFSPNLAYSVKRSETFTAYLLGQRPLFNDRLRGPGIVLYQEVPSTAQHTGITGRGVQGLLDGAMKAFGL